MLNVYRVTRGKDENGWREYYTHFYAAETGEEACRKDSTWYDHYDRTGECIIMKVEFVCALTEPR